MQPFGIVELEIVLQSLVQFSARRVAFQIQILMLDHRRLPNPRSSGKRLLRRSGTFEVDGSNDFRFHAIQFFPLMAIALLLLYSIKVLCRKTQETGFTHAKKQANDK